MVTRHPDVLRSLMGMRAYWPFILAFCSSWWAMVTAGLGLILLGLVALCGAIVFWPWLLRESLRRREGDAR